MIKCEACRAFYYFFRNKFFTFKNTEARMINSSHHMTLELLKNRSFGMKKSIFCQILRNVIIDVITQRYEMC